MTISVEAVTNREELAAHEPAWRQFVADSPTAELFSTPEWITSWLDAFWRDRPIEILFARDEGRLVGVAPLVRDETGTLRCRGALALPSDAVAWRGEITQESGDATATLEALLGHLAHRGPFRLALGRIATDSAMARALRDVAERRGLWTVWREDHSTPVIGLPASLDEYLQSRSKHVRHELRRKQKKLEKAGAVELRVVRRADELEAAFADVKAIEARSWKGEARSSFLEGPGAEGFYRDLYAKTVDRGWGRIYLLYFNGRPAAHLFGMVFRNRYYAFNSSFDTSLGEYSPGAMVVLRAIEDACGEKLDLFDFLGSEYRWKGELATAMREHMAVCVFPHLLSKCGVCWTMDQQVKPYVRKHLPWVLRAKRSLVNWGRGHRSGRERPAQANHDAAAPPPEKQPAGAGV
jgi:CelD/BcsL family acetyltransferase involved in cellulose biosynthesis